MAGLLSFATTSLAIVRGLALRYPQSRARPLNLTSGPYQRSYAHLMPWFMDYGGPVTKLKSLQTFAHYELIGNLVSEQNGT
ncbi:hypothetical protein BDP81DRAFT_424209 [Colletotrichum phormii]|uniref:Uncharacterized protein n=1 Tax=Colletotrichum phormii TaxID=359342 RepID=A0AAI9ZW79_9PEZI|nr:uncharacterized protein BDP81DRAFT_424209 [Colletotrichum phormii]KAK1638118.1 hypothetical protein BDP81DRAFT_424209 [Colletotrichum phormii]